MKGNDETQQVIRSENDASEKGNIRKERSSKRKDMSPNGRKAWDEEPRQVVKTKK